MRNASAKRGKMRRQKGEKIQEGLLSVVNIILLWCFLKRHQKEKKNNMVFNYYRIMKELQFLCMWPNRWGESLVLYEVI